MTEEQRKRQRISNLLDAQLNNNTIADIVRVNVRTVCRVKHAKNAGNGIDRASGSGGQNIKRNQRFLDNLAAKIKEDPTISMKKPMTSKWTALPSQWP
jgi:hypothetical protein